MVLLSPATPGSTVTHRTPSPIHSIRARWTRSCCRKNDIARSVAGIEYRRRVTLKGGMFTAKRTRRRVRSLWRIALRWVASPLLMIAHPRVDHSIRTGRTLDAGSGGLVQDSKSVAPALNKRHNSRAGRGGFSARWNAGLRPACNSARYPLR